MGQSHLLPSHKSITEKYMYLLLLFFAGSFIGFAWEVLLYWFRHSDSFFTVVLNLRGFLKGTWLPIYGIGFMLIYLINKPLKSHFYKSFFLSSIICGIVEYMSSWILEIVFNVKFWDYSHHFLNLNGRISLLSVSFFGIAGILIVSFIEPFFKKALYILPIYIRNFFAITLGVLFMLDVLVSLFTI